MAALLNLHHCERVLLLLERLGVLCISYPGDRLFSPTSGGSGGIASDSELGAIAKRRTRPGYKLLCLFEQFVCHFLFHWCV